MFFIGILAKVVYKGSIAPMFNSNKGIMKYGQAAGDDGIPKEIWKIPYLAQKIYEIILKIWREKKIL